MAASRLRAMSLGTVTQAYRGKGAVRSPEIRLLLFASQAQGLDGQTRGYRPSLCQSTDRGLWAQARSCGPDRWP